MNPIRREDRFMLPLAVAALAAMTVILFAFRPAPILSDYVEWTYHGVLLRDLLHGHAAPAYLLKNYPVPNSLNTLGLALLMLALPWKIATKLWLVVSMAVGFACSRRLQAASTLTQPSQTTSQNWRALAVTASILIGIGFWCGFTNFLFGVYFAMAFCALLLRGQTSRWLYAAILTLTFFSHMIPLGFELLILALYVLQTRRWHLLWQTAPPLALSLWYIAGRLLHANADGHAGMAPSVPYMSPAFAAFRVNSFLKCWGFVNLASTFHDSILLRLAGWPTFLALFLLNAIVAWAILWMMLRSCFRSLNTPAHPHRFFWIAAAIFGVVALLMPEEAAGISDPGGRMLQVAVWCGLCVVTAHRRWTGLLLAACSLILAAASCLQMAAIGEQPPLTGSLTSPLPSWMRQFAHVVYTDRLPFYDDIDTGRRDRTIYPTAMFLNKTQLPARPQTK